MTDAEFYAEYQRLVLLEDVDPISEDALHVRDNLTKARGRYVCTQARPFVETCSPTFAAHPDAEHDSCPEGCCDRFKCPYCGVKWSVEYD